MNTEDSEFERIEREQAMRNVPDPIHHTDTSEPLMYIQGWNDCRQAMLATLRAAAMKLRELGYEWMNDEWKHLDELAEQPAQQEPEIVQRVKRYAGQTLRTARNPNITARECIELADWLATTQQAQQETVAWGIIASNTGRICQVELDADEVEGHNPKHIVPLCRCS